MRRTSTIGSLLTKKFDSKIYRLYDGYLVKNGAKRRAEILRREGYRARVYYHPGRRVYYVYTRHMIEK